LDENDDKGVRNKGRPDGNKKAKEWIKIEKANANLASKIEEMTKSKESITMKILEAKMLVKDKKNEMKKERWKGIRDLEERKIALEDKKTSIELLAEENRTMMMDTNLMDAFTREWWDLRRMKIIARRRQAMSQTTFGEGAIAGSGATLGGGASEEGGAA
jgi:hypothetical protein